MTSLHVYDVQGRLVKALVMASNAQQTRLQLDEPGIYHSVFESNTGERTVAKVLVVE